MEYGVFGVVCELWCSSSSPAVAQGGLFDRVTQASLVLVLTSYIALYT